MHFLRVISFDYFLLLLMLVLLSSGQSFAQTSSKTEQNEKRNAMALGIGFLPEHHDETFVPAVELSYMYGLNERFAAGLGAGIHFTNQPFYVIAARGDMAIYKGLGVGVLFGSAIQERKPSVMAGAEISYGFEWGDFQLGPVIELSHHHKHVHFMIGLQLSYLF